MCESIPAASSPRANSVHLIHDESQEAGHLVVNSVPDPWAFANNKKLAS